LKIIGLTGDAGSGKSTVTRMLAELGATVVDADQIAHELIVPGSPVFDEIVAAFGTTMLAPDGTLDRPRLAVRIFTDSRERERLNRITHPPALAILKSKITAARNRGRGILVVEVPLLLETGTNSLVDEVWLVTADRPVKLARLRARGLDPELADQLLAAQMPQEQKIKHAHQIIDNNDSLTRTRQQVIKCWTELKVE
jgi:dephospho-CoA kinase